MRIVTQEEVYERHCAVGHYLWDKYVGKKSAPLDTLLRKAAKIPGSKGYQAVTTLAGEYSKAGKAAILTALFGLKTNNVKALQRIIQILRHKVQYANDLRCDFAEVCRLANKTEYMVQVLAPKLKDIPSLGNDVNRFDP